MKYLGPFIPIALGVALLAAIVTWGAWLFKTVGVEMSEAAMKSEREAVELGRQCAESDRSFEECAAVCEVLVMTKAECLTAVLEHREIAR